MYFRYVIVDGILLKDKITYSMQEDTFFKPISTLFKIRIVN